MSQVQRTLLKFKPSRDMTHAASLDNPGKARYRAKIITNGKISSEEISISPEATTLVVESPLEADVAVFLDCIDDEGNSSLAKVIQYKATGRPVLQSPSELTIDNVAVLEVTDVPPSNEVKAIAKPQIPIPPSENEAKSYSLTISGHPEIKDGAVGTILGINPGTMNVVVGFAGSALKPTTDGKPRPSTLECEFPLDNPYSISVISPSQERITLAKYHSDTMALVKN